jgi:hypothetical protein
VKSSVAFRRVDGDGAEPTQVLNRTVSLGVARASFSRPPRWIVVVVLYALGMGSFHVIGGLGAAADAFERWGRHSASARGRRASSSSA